MKDIVCAARYVEKMEFRASAALCANILRERMTHIGCIWFDSSSAHLST